MTVWAVHTHCYSEMKAGSCTVIAKLAEHGDQITITDGFPKYYLQLRVSSPVPSLTRCRNLAMIVLILLLQQCSVKTDIFIYTLTQ